MMEYWSDGEVEYWNGGMLNMSQVLNFDNPNNPSSYFIPSLHGEHNKIVFPVFQHSNIPSFLCPIIPTFQVKELISLKR